MSNFNQGGRPQRQIFDVSALNIKCEECNAEIKELPFEPKDTRPVYCRDCNANRRKNF